jgi:hypothetical protein
VYIGRKKENFLSFQVERQYTRNRVPKEKKKPTPRTYNSFFLPLKNPAYTTHNYRILRRFIYFFGERERKDRTHHPILAQEVGEE